MSDSSANQSVAPAQPTRDKIYEIALRELETRHPVPTTVLLATRIANALAAQPPAAQPPAAPVEMDDGKEWIVPHEDCLNCQCHPSERCAGYRQAPRSSAETSGQEG